MIIMIVLIALILQISITAPKQKQSSILNLFKLRNIDLEKRSIDCGGYHIYFI
jgi:hypothetical protein